MDTFFATLVAGLGATLAVDLWALLRRRWLGLPLPDYGLVGRWLGGLPRGRFRHTRIADSAPLRGERVLGWSAHYLIGVAFAALLPLLWGAQWLRHPTLAPAVLVGLATVLAPFLLMQPGMGAGIAASRTPNPAKARLHSLLTHLVFGLGLYASAWAATLFTH
jgi:hypothetical protein